ncbi:nucleotide exchange factor GrpE [Candidatus Saccharibacteria bacterium]|nr:nucleotide exchange factor GrpE [Candidatus Saccharibacteria bacterium]
MNKKDKQTPAAETPDYEAIAQQLAEENATKDAQIAELTNDLQRTRADFENFRRNKDAQQLQYGDAVKFATVQKILPLIDDSDRAIAANPDTLAPLAKNLEKTMSSLNLTKIPSDAGVEFDPELHEAITVEGDGDKELVAETLRAGYYYEGGVIRTAMVKVAKQ